GGGGRGQVGGGGCGEVRKAAGRGAGGGQRGLPAAGRGQRRRAAGASAREAQLDQAPQEVQGRGVRADEGRGGAAHAVLQRVPAAVLLPDDGRDGGVHVAGGGGDGDAGGQRDDEDRADHADRDGERAAVRDPGGWADSGRGRRDRDRRVRRCRARSFPWAARRASAATTRRRRTGGRTRTGWSSKSIAVGARSTRRTRRRSKRPRGVALTARAPDSKSGGWGFES